MNRLTSVSAFAWLLLVTAGMGCGGTIGETNPDDSTPRTPGVLDESENGGTQAPSTPSFPDVPGTQEPSGEIPEQPNKPARVDGLLWRVTAQDNGFANFTRESVELNPQGELVLVASGGMTANDPYGPGGFSGGTYYNGRSYRYGLATSPEKVVKGGFDTAVPSFEVDTPPGTWVTLKLAARIGGAWTRDYVMGVWAFDQSTVRRHSVNGQNDAQGNVLTDTLELKARADAFRYTVALFSEGNAVPRVRALSVAAKLDAVDAPAPAANPALWGTDLDVPMSSQMIYQGGNVWCSPTSTTMLLAYWGKKLGLPNLAESVPSAATANYDWIYDGTGNWPFNTAYAAHRGQGRLHAFVTRLSSFSQLEPLVKAGVPVSISIQYVGSAPRLTGAPLTSVNGHLIVVRGFDPNGNVIVNDPAFPSEARVKTTYNRAELQRAWHYASDGLTYVIHPVDLVLPVDPLGAY